MLSERAFAILYPESMAATLWFSMLLGPVQIESVRNSYQPAVSSEAGRQVTWLRMLRRL